MASKSWGVIKKELEESGLLTTYILRPSASENSFTVYNNFADLLEVFNRNDGEKRIVFDPVGLTNNIININTSHLNLDMGNTTWVLDDSKLDIIAGLSEPSVNFNSETTFINFPTFNNSTRRRFILKFNNSINPVYEFSSSATNNFKTLSFKDLNLINLGTKVIIKLNNTEPQHIFTTFINCFFIGLINKEVFEMSGFQTLKLIESVTIGSNTIKGIAGTITVDYYDMHSIISGQTGFAGTININKVETLSNGDNNVPFLT